MLVSLTSFIFLNFVAQLQNGIIVADILFILSDYLRDAMGKFLGPMVIQREAIRVRDKRVDHSKIFKNGGLFAPVAKFYHEEVFQGGKRAEFLDSYTVRQNKDPAVIKLCLQMLYFFRNIQIWLKFFRIQANFFCQWTQ